MNGAVVNALTFYLQYPGSTPAGFFAAYFPQRHLALYGKSSKQYNGGV
jgi:hypothetical protein